MNYLPALLLAPSVLLCLGQATAPSPESVRRAQIADRASRPPASRPAPPPAPVYRGVDLAKAPVTTHVETLPEIWEARPPGSHSYEVRTDVTLLRPDMQTTLYWRQDKNLFFIQHDGMGASTHHFYGPFTGNPNTVLSLDTPTTAPATQPTTRP